MTEQELEQIEKLYAGRIIYYAGRHPPRPEEVATIRKLCAEVRRLRVALDNARSRIHAERCGHVDPPSDYCHESCNEATRALDEKDAAAIRARGKG